MSAGGRAYRPLLPARSERVPRPRRQGVRIGKATPVDVDVVRPRTEEGLTPGGPRPPLTPECRPVGQGRPRFRSPRGSGPSGPKVGWVPDHVPVGRRVTEAVGRGPPTHDTRAHHVPVVPYESDEGLGLGPVRPVPVLDPSRPRSVLLLLGPRTARVSLRGPPPPVHLPPSPPHQSYPTPRVIVGGRRGWVGRSRLPSPTDKRRISVHRDGGVAMTPDYLPDPRTSDKGREETRESGSTSVVGDRRPSGFPRR